MASRIPLVCLFVLALCSSLFAAQPARSLRDVLSAEAFKKAGLEKLSDEELSFLSLQLFGETKAGRSTTKSAEKGSPVVEAGAPEQGVIASLPHGEEAFGLEEKLTVAVTKIQRVPQEINSRVKGPFKGWSGSTVFVLENGQRWKQSEAGHFDVTLESPEVSIRKGLFGVFFLNVKGYGSTVKVKRLE